MDNRPVGIFDSGLGGLTALGAFHQLLPDENLIYLADTLHCPYGEKDVPALRTLAQDNLNFMARQNVKLIIVACGTLSANCGEILSACPVHTENVLRVSMEALERYPGQLGVIATKASIQSGAFSIRGRDVRSAACPDFVPLIENGYISETDFQLHRAIERYLSTMRGVSALLLGCTHYGIIQQPISRFLGENTAILSASDCVAASSVDYLKTNNLLGGEGRITLYCTGDTESFDRNAERILHAFGCGNLHAQRAWV